MYIRDQTIDPFDLDWRNTTLILLQNAFKHLLMEIEPIIYDKPLIYRTHHNHHPQPPSQSDIFKNSQVKLKKSSALENQLLRACFLLDHWICLRSLSKITYIFPKRPFKNHKGPKYLFKKNRISYPGLFQPQNIS